MAIKEISLSIEENSRTHGEASITVDAAETTANIDTWVKAVDKITLGKSVKVSVSEFYPLPTPLLTKSAPKEAQRGEKVIVKGRCSVTDDPRQKIHTRSIPTANKIYIATAGSDKIDMTQTDVAAYVTATNAIWKDENGKAIVIYDMEYANRSVQ